MYLGIDFGTSNSSIAEFFPGEPLENVRVHPTRGRQALVLPTAVSVSGSQKIVGHRAYERLESKNTMKDFKRNLNSPKVHSFLGGATLTASQACTEVLKELLMQARSGRLDGDLLGAVLTRPVKCDPGWEMALKLSAEHAGIRPTITLSEPEAACVAADAVGMFETGDIVLVYDLGAGTFDYSLLLKNNRGMFKIIDNGGNKTIGGGNFNTYIFDKIFLPWLHEIYSLEPGFQNSKIYEHLVGKSQMCIEEAKITLSDEVEVTAHLSDDDLRYVTDEVGNTITISIEISRDQINALIESDLRFTVDQVSACLEKNNFSPSKIDHVVLVGGPTHTPLLRELLNDKFGKAICPISKFDPMTLVARGAAHYCEGANWKCGGPRVPTLMAFDHDFISISYSDRVAGDFVALKILKKSSKNIKHQIEVRSERGWSSGLQHIESSIDINAHLRQGENNFTASVFSPDGRLVWTNTEKIRVLRVAGLPKELIETSTVSIQVSYDDGLWFNDRLLPLVKKGDPLPAIGERNFVLYRPITPDKNVLRVDLFTQEEDSNTTPGEPNIHMLCWEITFDDLPPEGIPEYEGVTIRWQRSRLDEIVLEIEIGDYDFKQNHKLLDVTKEFAGETGLGSANHMVTECRAELISANSLAGHSDQLIEFKRDLETVEVELAASVGSRHEVERFIDRIRALRNKISLITNSAECQTKIVQQKLSAEVQRYNSPSRARADEILPHISPKFDTLCRECEKLLQSGDPSDHFAARSLIWEMVKLRREVESTIPESVINSFRLWEGDRATAINKEEFDEDVRAGRRHIEHGDIDQLRKVVRRLVRNQFGKLSDLQLDE